MNVENRIAKFAGADERIALFEAAAAFANPGDWTIVATAVPPLS